LIFEVQLCASCFTFVRECVLRCNRIRPRFSACEGHFLVGQPRAASVLYKPCAQSIGGVVNHLRRAGLHSGCIVIFHLEPECIIFQGRVLLILFGERRVCRPGGSNQELSVQVEWVLHCRWCSRWTPPRVRRLCNRCPPIGLAPLSHLPSSPHHSFLYSRPMYNSNGPKLCSMEPVFVSDQCDFI